MSLPIRPSVCLIAQTKTFKYSSRRKILSESWGFRNLIGEKLKMFTSAREAWEVELNHFHDSKLIAKPILDWKPIMPLLLVNIKVDLFVCFNFFKTSWETILLISVKFLVWEVILVYESIKPYCGFDIFVLQWMNPSSWLFLMDGRSPRSLGMTTPVVCWRKAASPPFSPNTEKPT